MIAMLLLLDIEHPHQTALDVVKDVENYGGEVVHVLSFVMTSALSGIAWQYP